MKNSDLGLEHAALSLGPRAAFSGLSHSFLLYGPPSWQIPYIYLTQTNHCTENAKITSEKVHNSLIASTNPLKKS